VRPVRAALPPDSPVPDGCAGLGGRRVRPGRTRSWPHSLLIVRCRMGARDLAVVAYVRAGGSSVRSVPDGAPGVFWPWSRIRQGRVEWTPLSRTALPGRRSRPRPDGSVWLRAAAIGERRRHRSKPGTSIEPDGGGPDARPGRVRLSRPSPAAPARPSPAPDRGGGRSRGRRGRGFDRRPRGRTGPRG